MRTTDLPKGQTLASLKPGEKASFWLTYPVALAYMIARWNSGDSAIAIAKSLTNDYGTPMSRSAVLGKVSRMGLLRLDQRGSAITRVKQASKVKHAEKVEKPVKEYHPPPEPSGMRDLPMERPATAVSLYDAKRHQCRWPVGRPEELLCCGVRQQHGAKFPYCPDHYDRALRRYTPKVIVHAPFVSKYR